MNQETLSHIINVDTTDDCSISSSSPSSLLLDKSGAAVEPNPLYVVRFNKEDQLIRSKIEAVAKSQNVFRICSHSNLFPEIPIQDIYYQSYIILHIICIFIHYDQRKWSQEEIKMCFCNDLRSCNDLILFGLNGLIFDIVSLGFDWSWN